MEKQITLFKGELMEELLRKYFLSLGYYVARSVKYKYEDQDITDIDLYLYGRSSSLTRERINVDIKNKKSPQAFERIIWANGIKQMLNFNSCIVATTDQKPVIHKYGNIHKTTILDGAFLAKLKSESIAERLSEDDLMIQLSEFKDFNVTGNKDWRSIYEASKSKLLSEQDFSGFNSILMKLHYFIEKCLISEQQRLLALRMTYILLSHLLVIMDFILKDIVFLEQSIREKRLSNGLTYGNLGKEGIDRIIDMATKISGTPSAGKVYQSLEDNPTHILKEYFSKTDNSKSIFQYAKDLENIGFKVNFTYPGDLDAPLKSVLAVMLDYFSVERVKFFNLKHDAAKRTDKSS